MSRIENNIKKSFQMAKQDIERVKEQVQDLSRKTDELMDIAKGIKIKDKKAKSKGNE